MGLSRRRTAPLAGLLSIFAILLVGTGARAAAPTEVILVKRGGVMAYEEIAEAFREGCRVRAREISVGEEGFGHPRFAPTQLVITVGQEAFDAVSAAPGRLIATLAFHIPASVLGPRATPGPELILRLLATARPGLKVVGVVHGPRSRDAWVSAQQAAHRLGIELRGAEVENGPAGVRALREMIDGVEALWLPADTDVISPQVFQYALLLQIERGVPVAAATRQQVHSGALLAVDFNPRDVGHSAAEIANLLLEGRSPHDADRLDLLSGARMSVNRDVARRLGADLEALHRLGARIE